MARSKARKGALRVLPSLRKDREGVAGVVAASLGVVMISVLLGMVVTFWVPAWGYDNEVAHSRACVNAFAEFQNALELQTLARDKNQTLSTTFPLGVGGVPLFGAETPGQLSFQYLDGGKIRFRVNLSDATGAVNFSSTGSLLYTMPNRYYVPQVMAFETGAVIVSQRDGQTVRLPPPFRFVNGSAGTEVYLTLFSLEGTLGAAAGVDSHAVSSTLSALDTRTFSWSSNNTVTLNVTTAFVEGWASYFSSSMNASTINGTAFNITRYPASAPESVTLRLTGVRALTVTVSALQIKVS